MKAFRKISKKLISRLAIFTISCLVFLLIISIPITNLEVVINTSLEVNPGIKVDPYDTETVYHTRILCKSALNGEISVEGEDIYLTVHGYNTQHLKNIFIAEQYNFLIDPADDLYTFIFDNTEGLNESFIKFKLEEIWIIPMVFGSPVFFIAGLIGFFLFLTGLVALAISVFHSKESLLKP